MAFGAAIGLAAIQQGMGMGTAAFNNWLAQEREREARWENFKYNEAAADFADKRTRALYNDLQSPRALLSQYREAGLSPSLMFSGGGAGGGMTQGAMGNGTSGVMPTTYGVSPAEVAQTQLIQAQARLANAKANTEEGTNQRGQAEISELIGKSNNVALKNQWQEYENVIKYLDAKLKEQTNDDYIEIAHLKVQELEANKKKLVEEARSAKVKADIDEKTENDVIKFVQQQVSEQYSRILLNKCMQWKAFADIKMSQAQMASLAWSVRKEANELDIDRNKLKAQITQWAAENGFKEKDQQIAIAKIVVNAFLALRGQDMQTFNTIINGILPFGSGTTGEMPNIGMPPVPNN